MEFKIYCIYMLFLEYLRYQTLSLMRYNTTSPAYKKVVPGEGMPLSHDVSTKGNLIITFDVHFPEKLSPESKQLIKRALSFKQSNVKDNVKV